MNTYTADSIRTVDVSAWEDWESPDMTRPYEVVASPHGETVRAYFATADEALEHANAIAALAGTYDTSWGTEAVNTEATIYLHVVPAPALVVGAEVRVTAGANDDVVGGGTVIAMDDKHVTVEQVSIWTHNGVEVERSSSPVRFSRNAYKFLPVPAVVLKCWHEDDVTGETCTRPYKSHGGIHTSSSGLSWPV